VRVLGLDPGQSGAYASWDGHDLTTYKVPSYKSSGRGKEVDWLMLAEAFELMFGGCDHAFIEKVGARPQDGGSSAFKFGSTYGAQRMLVVVNRIPITDVAPTTWKMTMGLSSDKKKSFALARQLFPSYSHLFDQKNDDGVAEAALLAYYGRQKLLGEKVR
jgi:crossover junction endodeoxyribonuclease RuvC